MVEKNKRIIEVCFSPALYPEYRNDEAVVVVADILRATSAIVTAFMNGVNKIIPVATLEEALLYKKKGYLVAAERDGIVRDFADFGNSPFNFKHEQINGREIVYSTTNGTHCITLARESYRVVIGAYLNINAIAEYLRDEKRDVIILCAGWKRKFNLEDSVFAGALADVLLKSKEFTTICDSTYASVDLWNLAKNDLVNYMEKAAQRHRLRKNGLDDVIDYCHTIDIATCIPVLKDNYLVELNHL